MGSSSEGHAHNDADLEDLLKSLENLSGDEKTDEGREDVEDS